MNLYALFLAFVGIVVLAAAWLPLLLRRLPLSLPIICVLLGYGVFSLFSPSRQLHPISYPDLAERLTELVVIVSLMGAGLKIKRRIGWREWLPTWRLLAVTMPLSILGMAITGWWLLGLAPAAAILLGAVLAPTDPVLASDVQLGPPGSEQEDETRFALTSEAGLNDGLAFPFTHLALAAAAVAAGAGLSDELTNWVAYEVLWKIAAGIVAGYLSGQLFARLMFRLPMAARLAAGGDGFAALGATLAAYGVTELVHGYGFLAVFIAAITLRRTDAGHQYHAQLHDFAEQIERLLMLLVLVVFGGTIAAGMLEPLTWPAAIAGMAFIFVIRPLCGWIGLAGLKQPRKEKMMIAFFGIRGIGSFYYLAYALNHGTFDNAELLWALIGFVVLMSIVVHGMTVTPLMDRLDGRSSSERDPRQ
ncbi:cation:proton antiporter [Emcibacter sp. SYSU 3D8]|uniref:cation:proton antiporter n=1 Tax=Emcibacter sp. SYSU 3D8 TaxID=3133969 RepID=UPI0031FE594D